MTPDFWLGLTAGILVGAVLAAVLFAWAGYALRVSAARALAADRSFDRSFYRGDV